jgi:T4 RnlA family RNA ligase
MNLHIQTYLRSGNSLGDLKAEYGIDAKWSERHDGLVLFKYDQIESPEAHPIVCECRGIILDEAHNWDIVARPFDRFFNWGSSNCAQIDWSTARVQEKVDGSLMTVYYYGGQWNVASSGNPDAAGEVNGFGFTFNDLFWKTWEEQGFSAQHLHTNFTYIFELTSPYNRIIVPHKEAKLTALGLRNRDSGVEYPVSILESIFPVVQEFPLQSIEDVLSSFSNFEGLNQEGYVIVDGAFNRIKVKHPGYVALHRMKDSLTATKKNLVEIVRQNEGEEFLTYFPEFKESYTDIKDRFYNLANELSLMWDEAKKETDRKSFAAVATKTRLPAALFAMLDKRVATIREYLAGMQIDHLQRALGVK